MPKPRDYGVALTRAEDWELIYPKPAEIKSVVMSSDHADEELKRIQIRWG